MAEVLHAESGRMYSWWWDSHIYPKNSKWLQKNLTDMDVKVKSMIKLIEEDGNSFARKAEMYYKKRPELMKLVEEFYRAYRALAERYDHATRAFWHARNTTSEAIENHAPLMFADYSPAAAETDPRPPQMLKPEAEETLALKGALAKLEAEKEAGVFRHQQCLDKLSDLQREMSKTRDEFRGLIDHASKAENEAVVLREAVTRLEAQKESKLQDCKQEDAQKHNESATNDKSAGEENDALSKYISKLENKLQHAEEEGRKLKERAEKAESEVELLRQSTLKLTVEKEAAVTQYQQYFKTLSIVESKLTCAQKEVESLKVEIDYGASKFKSAEEKCHLLETLNKSLRSEMESLIPKMGTQTRELTRKQKELGRLYRQLEGRRRTLEKEKESTLSKVEELRASLDAEEQEHARYVQMTDVRISSREMEMRVLQEECERRKAELDRVLDNVIASEIQTIVMNVTAKQMREGNCSLSTENQKLGEESRLSATKIVELEWKIIEQQDEIKSLHDKLNERKKEEEILQHELQKNLNEIDEMETETASISGWLYYSMVSQLIYEQKALELREACLHYMDQNKCLKTQFTACGPEILSLRECISSLENLLDVHIKTQDPENDELQGARVANDPHEVIVNDDKKAFMTSTFSDLCNLRARLQATVKAAVEVKENVDLHSKLVASTSQLELLESESVQRGMRVTSDQNKEADSELLTKDIVLNWISDSSSRFFRETGPVNVNNRPVELWETGCPDGNIGLTFRKSKKIVSPSSADNTDSRRVRSMKKQKGQNPTSDSIIEDQSVEKLEIPKRFGDPVKERKTRKFLQRFNSDVQNLESLQITVQDLKRKLEITSTNKTGKYGTKCEVLRVQLQEAETTVAKLLEFNERLMKSINFCFFSITNSSCDLEENGSDGKRKILQQAQKMAESIGRLEVEVQKLKYSLQKLDNEDEVKTNTRETRRILKDYLYEGGRSTCHRQKITRLCPCMQPSTNEV